MMCLCVVLGSTCFIPSKVKYREVGAPCMFLLGINAFESLIIFAVVSELHCCMTCSFNFYFSKLTLYTECCIELSESCTWLQALRKILSDYKKKQVSGSIGSGLQNV